ncbi:TPA: hypothetical protein ACXP3I_003383 [Klebsiella pneumoniae]
MNIETVNELIQSLESAGELSIKETKVMALAKAFKQLAAENVAMKAAFHPSDIPSEWTDVFGDTAVIEHDAAGDNQGHSISWSWVDNQEEVIKSVLLAVDKGIETPATDRIVAGIKADGVEMFALMFAEEAIKDNNITTGWKARASRAASEYAELLREGAK